jgi:hypothetical protein
LAESVRDGEKNHTTHFWVRGSGISLRGSRRAGAIGVARAIGETATIRRLLTASGIPELKTFVALANALDADLVAVPQVLFVAPDTPKCCAPQVSEACNV